MNVGDWLVIVVIGIYGFAMIKYGEYIERRHHKYPFNDSCSCGFSLTGTDPATVVMLMDRHKAGHDYE